MEDEKDETCNQSAPSTEQDQVRRFNVSTYRLGPIFSCFKAKLTLPSTSSVYLFSFLQHHQRMNQSEDESNNCSNDENYYYSGATGKTILKLKEVIEIKIAPPLITIHHIASFSSRDFQNSGFFLR